MKLPCFGGLPFHARCRYPKFSIFFVLSIFLCLFLVLQFRPWLPSSDLQRTTRHGRNSMPLRVPVVLINWNKTDFTSKQSCRFHSCFDVNSCILGREDRIRVYVHDTYEFHSGITLETYVPEVSREYAEMLDAIRNSRYYEKNISEACVIVPSVDTLNQQQQDVELVSILLNSLPQ